MWLCSCLEDTWGRFKSWSVGAVTVVSGGSGGTIAFQHIKLRDSLVETAVWIYAAGFYVENRSLLP
jgi:hypothetical protein